MRVCRVEHNRRRIGMQVNVCEGAIERGRGLLFRRRPDAATAYLLPDCRAVHTIGLAYPIDVIFCDANGRILRIRSSLRPCRLARERRATQVWELAGGTTMQWGWQVGDLVSPC